MKYFLLYRLVQHLSRLSLFNDALNGANLRVYNERIRKEGRSV